MRLHPQSAVDQEKKSGNERRGAFAGSRGEIGARPNGTAFSRWLRGPWPIALVFFVLTLAFHSRVNTFPYYYEKDAPSKVEQVVTGKRNFYHPLLMLNATDLAMRVAQIPRTPQNAVETGRWCMTGFSAIAIAAFSILGFRLGGRMGAICVGTLLFGNPLLFELSHFFKEDPALLFGLALSMLAMQNFWERRTTGHAVWLGVTCGLAISGKYVGVAALLMAVILLITLRKDGGDQKTRWFAFLGGLLGSIAIIDYQFLFQIQAFRSGFQTEMADLTRDDKISTIPHVKQTIEAYHRLLPAGVAFLALVQVADHLRRRRGEPVRWLLFLYPIVFTGVLLFSPRLFTRHFLPVFAFYFVLAGLGIPTLVAWVCRGFGLPERRAVLPLSLALLIVTFFGTETQQLERTYQAFSKPTRERLFSRIRKELPPNAVIASDRRVYLLDPKDNPRPEIAIPCKVIVKPRLSDFKSVQELRDLGVTHIAAHGIDSRALFRDPSEMDAPESAERKGMRGGPFYNELREASELKWEYHSRGVVYISPGIKLYELLPPKAKETP